MLLLDDCAIDRYREESEQNAHTCAICQHVSLYKVVITHISDTLGDNLGPEHSIVRRATAAS